MKRLLSLFFVFWAIESVQILASDRSAIQIMDLKLGTKIYEYKGNNTFVLGETTFSLSLENIEANKARIKFIYNWDGRSHEETIEASFTPEPPKIDLNCPYAPSQTLEKYVAELNKKNLCLGQEFVWNKNREEFLEQCNCPPVLTLSRDRSIKFFKEEIEPCQNPPRSFVFIPYGFEDGQRSRMLAHSFDHEPVRRDLLTVLFLDAQHKLRKVESVVWKHIPSQQADWARTNKIECPKNYPSEERGQPCSLVLNAKSGALQDYLGKYYEVASVVHQDTSFIYYSSDSKTFFLTRLTESTMTPCVLLNKGEEGYVPEKLTDADVCLQVLTKTNYPLLLPKDTTTSGGSFKEGYYRLNGIEGDTLFWVEAESPSQTLKMKLKDSSLKGAADLTEILLRMEEKDMPPLTESLKHFRFGTPRRTTDNMQVHVHVRLEGKSDVEQKSVSDRLWQLTKSAGIGKVDADEVFFDQVTLDYNAFCLLWNVPKVRLNRIDLYCSPIPSIWDRDKNWQLGSLIKNNSGLPAWEPISVILRKFDFSDLTQRTLLMTLINGSPNLRELDLTESTLPHSVELLILLAQHGRKVTTTDGKLVIEKEGQPRVLPFKKVPSFQPTSFVFSGIDFTNEVPTLMNMIRGNPNLTELDFRDSNLPPSAELFTFLNDYGKTIDGKAGSKELVGEGQIHLIHLKQFLSQPFRKSGITDSQIRDIVKKLRGLEELEVRDLALGNENGAFPSAWDFFEGLKLNASTLLNLDFFGVVKLGCFGKSFTEIVAQMTKLRSINVLNSDLYNKQMHHLAKALTTKLELHEVKLPMPYWVSGGFEVGSRIMEDWSSIEGPRDFVHALGITALSPFIVALEPVTIEFVN
jgi:hypothetical protein